jgi:hypothetical protein
MSFIGVCRAPAQCLLPPSYKDRAAYPRQSQQTRGLQLFLSKFVEEGFMEENGDISRKKKRRSDKFRQRHDDG